MQIAAGQLPFDVRKNMRALDHLFDPARLHAPLLRLRKRLLRGKRSGDVGKLPQPGKKSLFRALADGELFPAAQDEDRAFLRSARFFRGLDGQLTPAAAPVRRAEVKKRAAFAQRRAVRQADRCAQLHQRLREFAAMPGGIDRLSLIHI